MLQLSQGSHAVMWQRHANLPFAKSEAGGTFPRAVTAGPQTAVLSLYSLVPMREE